MTKYFTIIITFSVFLSCQCLRLSSLDKTYQRGVKAYSKERWSECITQFEESLHLYKLYRAIIINCRLKCNTQEYKSDIIENIEDLKIYEQFFNKRNCLTNCQEKSFEDVHMNQNLEESVWFNMQARKPYEYLHLCYFQMNALPKAASAAYTYLVINPEDETMKNNLKYYVEQPEVDINEVVDLQSEDYEVLYGLGMKAYTQKNWAETAANMEQVLTDYFSSENRCRMECERQPNQEWSSEFVITISNNIASLLHCRQLCQKVLKPLKYNSGVEFIAEILNYMQISYYHLDRFDDAAKAVQSYLALYPHDEDMLENKHIYSTFTDDKAFAEISVVMHYFKRDTYEKKLLEFFHQGENNNIDTNTI